ncbi:MAG: hypothetical protein ACRDFB_06380 [Rhabdochlamydiaceae bacterium]
MSWLNEVAGITLGLIVMIMVINSINGKGAFAWFTSKWTVAAPSKK